MLLPLVLLFVLLPIVEIYAIIQVGQAIGAPWTVALLIADSILGSMLMRSQGRVAWRRFNAALAEGRPPTREILDGALVILGGALLVTPGFVTDVFGLALLLPPSRAIARSLLARRMAGRFGAAFVGRTGAAPPAASDYDIDGTASEVHDTPRLP
ncbi:MAG TPA: FxsA family protein [Solirubrobacteraceae bacterium]|nr:FxsA family protein [Solirubrobacteraceae bacterium]